ncbi:MAG: hypothetical protein P8O22_06030 [Akkermansiaceae bacterium]|nr:hypothetical protein [Akkermansiaceae bacterium]
MINRPYILITLIFLTLVGCKEKQMNDNSKPSNQDKNGVRVNKPIDGQEIGNPDEIKRSTRTVRRATPKKATKSLIDVALKSLNNRHLGDNEQDPAVTEDDKYFYVTWPNGEYDEKPDSPGGGKFKVEVILDKITKDVIFVRMPN